MKTVILYYITNGTKFYLDMHGYWTTDRLEAQHHWESQIQYIRNENPLFSLHNLEYELV